MDFTTFDKIAEEQFEICRETLKIKEKSYAPGQDRLEQFKKLAEFRKKTEFEIAADLMQKHTTKIYDLLDGKIKNFNLEEWTETIKDHINYLILAKAVLMDKLKELEENRYSVVGITDENCVSEKIYNKHKSNIG